MSSFRHVTVCITLQRYMPKMYIFRVLNTTPAEDVAGRGATQRGLFGSSLPRPSPKGPCTCSGLLEIVVIVIVVHFWGKHLIINFGPSGFYVTLGRVIGSQQWMEEILHHLRSSQSCISEGIGYITWCETSSIHSSSG